MVTDPSNGIQNVIPTLNPIPSYDSTTAANQEFTTKSQ